MQLSMWMIANQLMDFDIELNIQKDTPIVLRSARRAYATDCVHVMPDGKDVICTGEGGKILIKDIKIEYAFEIIQSIFDTYDIWDASIQKAAAKNDFQAVIDASWHAFHSPITLLNEDLKVLAMTSSVDMNNDEEWNYLEKHGYSSFQAIESINNDAEWRKHYSKVGAQRFHFPDKRKLSNCISAAVVHDNVRYGRVCVLEKNRPLNEGDMQLLNHLVRAIAPHLCLYYLKSTNSNSYNVFLEMLKGHRAKKQVFENRMTYRHWSQRDTYVIVSVDFQNDPGTMRMCVQRLSQKMPQAELTLIKNQIVLIINKTKDDYEKGLQIIEKMVADCNKYAGISLPFESLTWIQYYYRQATEAIRFGQYFSQRNPDLQKHVFEFYDYAVDCLLEIASGKNCSQLCACNPDAVKLSRECYPNGSDERLNTLYTYLKNDCSPSKTSQEMHLHKNTLLYRLKKITDSLSYPLEDKYSRDYLFLSLRVFGIYQMKYPKLLQRFQKNDLDQD